MAGRSEETGAPAESSAPSCADRCRFSIVGRHVLDDVPKPAIEC